MLWVQASQGSVRSNLQSRKEFNETHKMADCISINVYKCRIKLVASIKYGGMSDVVG